MSSAGGMAAMALTGLLDGTLAIMAAFVVAAAFFSPALPITDAYALTGLRPRGIAYGPVRLWGSVAFIAGNIGAGLLLERIAPGHLIWLIVAALGVATVAAVALVPLGAAEPAAGPAASIASSPNTDVPRRIACPAFIPCTSRASAPVVLLCPSRSNATVARTPNPVICRRDAITHPTSTDPSPVLVAACTRELPGPMTFSGNDRLVLFGVDDGEVLDAFGQIDRAPSFELWSNMNLRRCDLTPWDGAAFFPYLDYFSRGPSGNDFSHFGTPPTSGC